MKVTKLTSSDYRREQVAASICMEQELAYHFAQRISGELFLLGELTLEEYNQMTQHNLQLFQPYLYELMTESLDI